jgi:transcriptional regulator with XRE-family HTH domain
VDTTTDIVSTGGQPKTDVLPVLPSDTPLFAAHVPTRAGRRLIKRMVSAGLSQVSIAQVLEISQDTLTKYYRKELDSGLAESIALAERSLYRRGLRGDTTALIFWLKARAQWRDRDAMNVQVANIVPDGDQPKLDVKQVEDAVFKALAQMRPNAKSKPAVIEHSPS